MNVLSLVRNRLRDTEKLLKIRKFFQQNTEIIFQRLAALCIPIWLSNSIPFIANHYSNKLGFNLWWNYMDDEIQATLFNSLRPSDAYICVGNLTIIGSDNGLSPGRRQAIIWTNPGILLIGPLGTNFSEILTKIPAFSFKKMHLKMSSGK